MLTMSYFSLFLLYLLDYLKLLISYCFCAYKFLYWEKEKELPMDHYLQQSNPIRVLVAIKPLQNPNPIRIPVITKTMIYQPGEMQNINITEITHDRAPSPAEAEDIRNLCAAFNALPDHTKES